MSSCYVLLASTNVSLLCAVVNYQNLLASCGCRQAQRKQPSRDQEGSDGGTYCNVVYLKNLLAPFLHAYDFFMQTVKNIKQTWHTSVSGSVFEFVLLFKGGVKHSNNHSPNIITYHLQYISPLYDGRNATVIL